MQGAFLLYLRARCEWNVKEKYGHSVEYVVKCVFVCIIYRTLGYVTAHNEGAAVCANCPFRPSFLPNEEQAC